MATVRLNGDRISDGNTFHAVFAQTLGWVSFGLLCFQLLFSLPAQAKNDSVLIASHQMVQYPKSEHIERNKKRGFIDKTGKMIFNGRDADVMDWRFHEGLLRVRNLDREYEFWNTKGELAFPQKFELALWFQEGFAPVKKDGKWGYIDRSGALAIEPAFDMARPFVDGLAPVMVDGKWGYVSKSGRLTIKPQFDYCIEFSEGLAAASINGLVGYIDKTGKYVIKPAFHHCSSFADGVAGVVVVEGEPKFQHTWFIDHHGKKVFDYDKAARATYPEYVEERSSFKPFNFREVTSGQTFPPGLDPQMQDYYHFGPGNLEFSEGMLPVVLGNYRRCYFRPDGSVAFKMLAAARSFDHFSDGLAVIGTGDAYKIEDHVYDHSGNQVLPESFNHLSGFTDGVCVVFDGTTTRKIIDKDGKILGVVDTPMMMQFFEGMSRIGSDIAFPRGKYIPDFDYTDGYVPLDTLKFETWKSMQ